MSDHPKKLIEVSIPLEEINIASTREKSIRHGHPSTLHLWWARRPLAAARAILFAQLVDDPSEYVEELIADAKRVKGAEKKLGRKSRGPGDLAIEQLLIDQERERLHNLIARRVDTGKLNSKGEKVHRIDGLVAWPGKDADLQIQWKKDLNAARVEVQRSWKRSCQRRGDDEATPPPQFLDPFGGGGSIPIEAQRLGLVANASDLNPVAVLINKAMVEIPPKFENNPPVHPDARREMGTTGWKGAAGLAEDVRRYGIWMSEEAFRRIGDFYPTYKLDDELIQKRKDLDGAGYETGDQLTVITWLWARTVASPNPAIGGKHVPLVSSFWLSTKPGKKAWVTPVIEKGGYRFDVHLGDPDDAETVKAGTKTGRGANFRCLLSGVPIDANYVKAEGMAGRMGWKLLAIVAEGKGRVFLPPTEDHEKIGLSAQPDWRPPGKLATHPQYMSCTNYGPSEVADLFMQRQTLALSTLSNVLADLIGATNGAPEWPDDASPEYRAAIATYLAMGISRLANRQSTNTFWHTGRLSVEQVFARHALPFVWDTAEGNPFSDSSGNFLGQLGYLANVVAAMPCGLPGKAVQEDARSANYSGRIVSTDPPYYDNVPYADLSDFFYVWLRRSLRDQYPELFSTILVPKSEELVADSQRYDGKSGAEKYFLEGMTEVISNIARNCNPEFPTTIYYAFRHSEKKEEGMITSGWESFLQAVMDAGYGIDGTWPVRTELVGNLKKNWNALASSIVLVCRPRLATAPVITRREFNQALQRELPKALRDLQRGNIAPVDLPQSSIGPGMAIFSKYSKVIEADGSAMTVRSVLQLINTEVSNTLEGQISDMDDWTRFAVTWFANSGFTTGKFGDASNVATAFNVAVEGVAQAGIIESGQAKVRIYRPSELPMDWNPDEDDRLTVWEIVHHLIRVLEGSGEEAAASLFASRSIQAADYAENARALCYRLYTICEANKWADEARSYNGLITVWPELLKLSQTSPVFYVQDDLI